MESRGKLVGSLFLLGLVCGGFAWPVPAAEGEQSQQPRDQTQAWLQDLSARDFQVRERAMEGLLKLGEAVRPALERLTQDAKGDTEAVTRAKAMLTKLDVAAEALERAQNERALQERYVPKKEELLKSHKNKWLAVVSGKVVPANAEGRLEPADSIDQADAAARQAGPKARQRFLFRLGDEGNLDLELGGTEITHAVGSAFLEAVSPNGWEMSAGQFKLMVGQERVDVGIKGPDGRPYIRPLISAPLTEKGEPSTCIVATGFNGHAVITAAAARRLDLARWEIPGQINMQGMVQSGKCRRANLRVRLPQAKCDLTFPAAIWMDEAKQEPGF